MIEFLKSILGGLLVRVPPRDPEFLLYAKRAYNRALPKLKNKKYLTVIDFTLASTNKRFYVYDMTTNKLVYNTYVAHGSSSGGKFATEFSDTPESHQSSIGCCIINETYNSEKVGYAARLDGLEPGVNGKVRQRGIVLHGSKYVEEDYIKKNGQAGRSWGCPAIPDSLHKNIIDTVKGGSLMVMYYNNPYWLDSSFYVKGDE